MKKLIALTLSLMMLFCLTVSMAEQEQEQGLQDFGSLDANGMYALTGQVPEGYELTIDTAESGHLMGTLLNSDNEKPALVFNIIYDETYSDVERMNDLSQEDLDFLASTYTDPDTEISYAETAYGTKLMCVSSEVDSWDFLAILTIYKGYMIELDMFAGTGTDGTLTEEQKQMAIDFLSNMNFEAMAALPEGEAAPAEKPAD